MPLLFRHSHSKKIGYKAIKPSNGSVDVNRDSLGDLKHKQWLVAARARDGHAGRAGRLGGQGKVGRWRGCC